MASVLKVDTIKSLAGNEAMTISESGIITPSQQIVQPTPIFTGFSNQAAQSSTYETAELSVAINTEAGTFSGASQYRYTPSIAGYYRFTHTMTGTSASNNVGALIARIDKNGGTASARVWRAPNANNMSAYVEVILYMNGTSDYVQWLVWSNGTSPTINSYATGVLLRAGAEVT